MLSSPLERQSPRQPSVLQEGETSAPRCWVGSRAGSWATRGLSLVLEAQGCVTSGRAQEARGGSGLQGLGSAVRPPTCRLSPLMLTQRIQTTGAQGTSPP